MNWLLVINDFKRNKAINIALLLFMIFSATLAVTSVILGIQTFTSISELYKVAQPPHFLQMHKGELNEGEILRFMESYSSLSHGQIQAMININGEDITIIGDDAYDLSDVMLDISLVKQNDSRDLLLDSKHNKLILNSGEIGMPVLLKNIYDMKIGDKVVLKNDPLSRDFIIKEFILDSQMNSPMTSSTRILLSDGDFNELSANTGEHEYLIEAYFIDKNESSNFQTAYESSNLPKNGPTITYAIIFLLSALTDIAMMFVFILVSILLIIISFICVRFTISGALEEEIKEIGTMKAIGINFKDIRNIYLNKYKILASSGVILGYILSLLLSGIFTDHLSATFGDMTLSPLTLTLSLLVAFLVYLVIILYCKKVLKKIKKLTVVDALVSSDGFEKNKKGIKDGLYKFSKLPVNFLIGSREVFYNCKNYFIIFAVVLISLMMILIPLNLLNTFQAPEFITYMGSSLEDILIELESGENLESNYMKAINLLENDPDIKAYYDYGRVRVETIDADNELTNLNIDRGRNAGRDLQYLNGRAPNGDNEIAISYLNAEKIGKKSGDTIILRFDDRDLDFIISGIYQDVTDGGFTAKSRYNFPGLQAEKYSISVNLVDNSNVEEKADKMYNLLGPGVSVDPMEEFINQTLGGVSSQLETIVIAIGIIVGFMAILITVLYLKLRLARDMSEIAVLKALGFTNKDIYQQYLIKMGLISILGVLVGLLFTLLLGNQFINLALGVSGLGIRKVDLIINPLINYIICPLIILTIILSVTKYIMKTIQAFNIMDVINE